MVRLVLAFFQALPILEKIFQECVIVYTKYQVEKQNEEFIKKLNDAKKTKDVTALQQALGDRIDD